VVVVVDAGGFVVVVGFAVVGLVEDAVCGMTVVAVVVGDVDDEDEDDDDVDDEDEDDDDVDDEDEDEDEDDDDVDDDDVDPVVAGGIDGGRANWA
jgi:hypothetical protein